MRVRLVLLEAWNITRFIFVSNRRRENAGASELITYLDRKWVHEALTAVFPGFTAAWRIETAPAELLLTGAGSVRVLVRDPSLARKLVTEVTLSALREAPGLDVCGMVSAEFDWSLPGSLALAAQSLHEGFADALAGRPGPDHRFQRLPVTDECATTGLPASAEVRQPDGGSEPRSEESLRKWDAYGRRDEGSGLTRLAAAAGTVPAVLGKVVTHLEEQADWSAVVYADGNGLGEVFRDFADLASGRGNRAYADELRAFSGRLTDCTQEAFREAAAALRRDLPATQLADGEAPVLPLVLGGDDVIAVCQGEAALRFTEEYLRAFERLTAQAAEIREPLGRGGRGDSLSACAGVAVVKRHFPFTAAAGLAYQLMREAKVARTHVSGPCSAMSFEILYDSTDPELGRLRASTTFREPGAGGSAGQVGRLVAQPYLLSGDPGGWAAGRHWDDLLRRVTALSGFDADGERALPAGQVHALREALFISRPVAESRFQDLRTRYPDGGADALSGPGGALFWEQPDGQLVSGLLDAMNAAPFIGSLAGSQP